MKTMIDNEAAELLSAFDKFDCDSKAAFASALLDMAITESTDPSAAAVTAAGCMAMLRTWLQMTLTASIRR